jgi:hypothetical protein
MERKGPAFAQMGVERATAWQAQGNRRVIMEAGAILRTVLEMAAITMVRRGGSGRSAIRE